MPSTQYKKYKRNISPWEKITLLRRNWIFIYRLCLYIFLFHCPSIFMKFKCIYELMSNVCNFVVFHLSLQFSGKSVIEWKKKKHSHKICLLCTIPCPLYDLLKIISTHRILQKRKRLCIAWFFIIYIYSVCAYFI